ncbi:hypothetical protein MNV49_001126 [Pseudohyphozyma bogoriensis]|nr:hypothetical protein MNV49_001126 [Pseudohyphozyma bogoriensis]
MLSGPGTQPTSSLIGVAICVVGNVCISLALNIQKLAHTRLEASSSSSSSSEQRRSSVAGERSPLITPQRATYTLNPAPEDNTTPQNQRPEVVVSIPVGNGGRSSKGSVRSARSARKGAGQKRDEGPRVDKVYLKSKLWWAGLALLNLGELGNFVAYAFSPASLVAPLGTVALVANCALAPLILKEPFRKQDLFGIALAVLGGITVVWSSKSSDKKLFPSELIAAISTLPFIIYSVLSLVLGSTLAYLSRTKWGDRFVMIDIGVCAVAGGFTVLSTKAISSFLNLMFLSMFKEWITWPILVVLIGTALIQVNFVNKSLQRFESRIVIPAQFCSFSLSAIIGSAILYREFEGVDFDKAVNFAFGCGVSALGVYILTRSSSSSQHHNQAPRISEILILPPPVSPQSPTDSRPEIIRARTLSVTLGGSQYLLAQAQSPVAGFKGLPEIRLGEEGDLEAARLSAISSHLASTPKGLLAGEVAIITGAAQGIGRATALLFAQEGASVVVADLDASKAQAVVDEIKKSGGQAVAVGGDVTADDYPKKLIGETIKAFGRINHIVNNAGFTFDKMLHTMDDATFELILKVHNTAPFRIVREAAPYLRSKDPKEQLLNRSIVNISSTSGLHGNVGQVNYAVAKAGVVGLTKTIAKEWGPFGIRCNTVAFGYILTRLTQAKELGESITVGGKQVALGIPGSGAYKKDDSTRLPDIPLGRAGTPEEGAKAVLFLCSPLASYVSGHTLEVTGGRGI